MNQTRWARLAFLGAISFLPLTGCTCLYHYDFSGKVTRAVDEKPIPGVTIHLLNEESYQEFRKDPDSISDLAEVGVTRSDGTYSFHEKSMDGAGPAATKALLRLGLAAGSFRPSRSSGGA
jgi:hypothetical protein